MDDLYPTGDDVVICWFILFDISHLFLIFSLFSFLYLTKMPLDASRAHRIFYARTDGRMDGRMFVCLFSLLLAC